MLTEAPQVVPPKKSYIPVRMNHWSHHCGRDPKQLTCHQVGGWSAQGKVPYQGLSIGLYCWQVGYSEAREARIPRVYIVIVPLELNICSKLHLSYHWHFQQHRFSRSYWQRLFFSRSHSKLAALLSLCVSHSNEPSCRKYCFLKPRRVLCFRLCGRGYKTQQFVLYFGELSPYTPDHWTSKNVTEMAGSWIPVGFYSHHLEHTSMSSIKWISAMICGMPSHSRSQLYYDWTGKLT